MSAYGRTLYISDKLCNKPTNQVGGTPDPENVIRQVANMKNKYLYFDNCDQIFTFNPVANNKNDIPGSTYLGRGGYTAVFSILNENGKEFILRIEEQKTNNDLRLFIEQWKIDKNMFPKNIINILAYGIAIVDNVIVGTYTITDKYNDYPKIEKLNLMQKNEFIYNMLVFLKELKKNGIYYRDFKIHNIGFDKNLDFIVLDYDNITLMHRNSPIFINGCASLYRIPVNHDKNVLSRINSRLSICNGTYNLLIERYDYPDEYKDAHFDKYYCYALATIFTAVYFTNNTDCRMFIDSVFDHAKKYTEFEQQYTTNNALDETTVIYDNATSVENMPNSNNFLGIGTNSINNSNFANNSTPNKQYPSNVMNTSRSVDLAEIQNSIQNFNKRKYSSISENSTGSVPESNLWKELRLDELLTGGNNMMIIHNSFMEMIKNEIAKLTPAFNQYDCEVTNKYYTNNFYDKLLNFIKDVTVNMLNPNANSIYTEEVMVEMFNNVFLSTLPSFIKIDTMHR